MSANHLKYFTDYLKKVEKTDGYASHVKLSPRLGNVPLRSFKAKPNAKLSSLPHIPKWHFNLIAFKQTFFNLQTIFIYKMINIDKKSFLYFIERWYYFSILGDDSYKWINDRIRRGYI